MSFNELRKKHEVLRYRSFNASAQNGLLSIEYHLTLEPNIEFKPTLEIPLGKKEISLEKINNLIFHIGLIECLSYWKSACPKKIIVEAGLLSVWQITWFKKLLINGLSEFFFVNKIDSSISDLAEISCNNDAPKLFCADLSSPASSNLILVGGGKDSSLTMELLKNTENAQVLMLNPIPASLKTAAIAGFSSPIIARRTIDHKLLELNSSGYLNGHTPFSAYLAFLAALVAKIYNFKNIVSSNESSANEGNTLFKGQKINHQYSKSFEYESDFNAYLHELKEESCYFSFLRPLLDLQIAALFARHPQYFSSFKSCNMHHKKDSWCGACAKCAFVYLTLFPFLEKEERNEIFKSDYFLNEKIIAEIKALLGLAAHKPLECVGTESESREALKLCLEKYALEGTTPPKGLLALAAEIAESSNLLKSYWDDEHLVPAAELEILDAAFSEVLR